MTKQTLIINGVDWLDKRMIGLKCIFGLSPFEHTSAFIGISKYNDTPFTSEYDSDGNVNYQRHCRLAQGKKTPYVGKGQPVADGVMVKVWDGSASMCSGSISANAEDISWKLVKYYQVQEQKLDVEWEPVIIGHPPHIGSQNKSIPIELIARVVEALESMKDIIESLDSYTNRGRQSISNDAVEEIAEIDSLIKELEHV